MVVRTSGTIAWAKVDRAGGCEGCSQKGACGIGAGGKSVEVEAVNEAGARVGDLVLIDVKSASVLKAAFLLYVFPILAMLAGAVIGHRSPPFFQLGPSALSAIFGFSFFGAAVLFTRSKANRLARKEDYRLRITRVIRP
ncbi:Fis family transcriptional regulator [Candidatus Desulfarcum epimagneticum]|uniref:Fis family transcriptional regulator n=1 Tax=uncultured Desulfobacteraceae bacterium TaxID=218296 RepID=A0A484HBI8_9BACT|nr:Fis family transcriptional regulator [uncultured Desulfobacteraceae bacterium]